LLSASRKTILLQSEFGESFFGTAKIIVYRFLHHAGMGTYPVATHIHNPLVTLHTPSRSTFCVFP
jgi:hypothetical protein